MKEANVQEAFDHLKGYAEGLNMMLAYTINMVTDAEEREILFEIFDNLSAHSLLMFTQGNLRGEPRDRREPGYEGFRECMETMKTQLIHFRTTDAT